MNRTRPKDYRSHAALRRQQDRNYIKHLLNKLNTLTRQISRLPRHTGERARLIKSAARTHAHLISLGWEPRAA